MIWGDAAYGRKNFFLAIGGLQFQVILKMVVYNGINRYNSIFDVTVPHFNNHILNYLTKLSLSDGAMQSILLFEVDSKGVVIIHGLERRFLE
ncbi:unnamed protein product [Mycetohabitans rhizoxinica HKI 454]|uniref:Transposase n=1 Tax=Mycetohabitans rhizoxinica (strain DSM 19002 / CIP 109453 / HKI 454) TaxID=882378 RepID=E5ARN6_MYCRK|nr:unnamed protein product [Mycetohabitans rhizoxinica HKI 454]